MNRETRSFDEMTDLVDAAEAMDRLYIIRKKWRKRDNPLILGPEREAVWIIEIDENDKLSEAGVNQDDAV